MNDTSASVSGSKLEYRAEVDGLRAIAVCLVVLFHLGLPRLTGGYIGVDVFFVISGYLITSLVRREIAEGHFSFKRFYLRRIRRLSPALLLMLVATTPLAWWLLYPEDLSGFATSLALQPLSLQNVFFLIDGEYFRHADAKVLLHTWSLAVEEQFYLVWPLLLVVLARLSPRRGLILLAACFAASFCLNLALMRISPKASFFLLPPRAWELGAGALVALVEVRGAFATLTRYARTALCALGIALILGAAMILRPQSTFPGVAALLPVVGAMACLVATCGQPHHLSSALGHRGLVHVGLISYPLYLWHWPVLVLWRYGHPDRDGMRGALMVLVISVALAELTYRFVEQPIRQRRRFALDFRLLRGVLVGAAVMIGAGLHMRWSEGAVYRFSGVARALLTAPFRAHSDRCGAMFRVLHPLAQACPMTNQGAGRRVLAWGNSHADMWSGMLKELARENDASFYLNARNCRATVDSAFCGRHVQRAVLAFAKARQITDVIFLATWYGSYQLRDQVFEAELDKVVGELSTLKVRIWLTIDTPAGAALDPLQAFERAPKSPKFGSVPAASEIARRLRERALFERLATRYPNVRVIDPSPSFCDEKQCWGGSGTTAWYRDGGHLSDAGALRAKDHFAVVFTDPQ